MKKYMQEYVSSIEDKINNNYKFSKEDITIFKDKIAYFQHERLIHLLVTLFYAIFTIIFLVLGMISVIFLIPFFILCIFLIFYIKHYFYLENTIQYMYKLYDKII